MTKVTLEEVELLAQLLARAGVTQLEALWANDVLNKLRVIAAEMATPPDPQKPPSGGEE